MTVEKDAAAAVLRSVKTLIQHSVDPLRQAFDALPAAKDGKDVDMVEVERLIAAGVATAVSYIPPAINGEKGEKGESGKDAEPVDMDAITVAITDAVAGTMARIALPKDGKDADPIDMSAVRHMVDESVVQALSSRVEKSDMTASQFSAKVSSLLGKAVEVSEERPSG